MKKVIQLLVLGATVIILAACGSGSSASKNTLEDFTEVMNTYVEKQQNLMQKQAEGATSTEFEALSKHAKTVIESDQYKEWEDSYKKLSDFDTNGIDEAKEIDTLKEAITAYNDVQAEYFQELSKATDVDAYNNVNTELSSKLTDAQNKYIENFQDFANE